jgi:nucleoside-diphosphate-sugar epimerase
MRVLLIGGSGHVGGLVIPYLAAEHTLCVFDRRPPAEDLVGKVGYVHGDVCDGAALADAMGGVEAVVYMAMGTHHHPEAETKIHAAFDVNVKGVYLALDAAQRAGVRHAVYASSLSVFEAMMWGRNERRYYVDEDMPADAQALYGFTKRLGEEVCRNATREWKMSVNALRLCLPLADDRWHDEVRAGQPTIKTAASDVARAFAAALTLHAGYQVFHISGDYEEKLMRLTRARQLLPWEPLARPPGAIEGE